MRSDISRADSYLNILIILFVTEYLTLCLHKIVPIVGVVSIIHFVIGIAFIVIALQAKTFSFKNANTAGKSTQIFNISAGILVVMIFYHFLKRSFNEVPIDYQLADMLPVIRIMCDRYLTGGEPYAMIYEIWDGTKPIYLPAMWMPFILAVISDIDMRWIPVMAFLCGIGVSSTPMFKSRSFRYTPLLTLSLGGLLVLLLSFYKDLFVYTEEGLIIAYYLLMAAAIRSRNPWLTGLALACCLMSRYSLVFWTILGAGVYLLDKQYLTLAKIVVSCGVICVLWMTIGGAWQHIDTFITLPRHYVSEMLLDPDKYIPELQKHMGIAKFIPFKNLEILNRISIILAVLTPLTMIVLYRRHRHIPSDLFLLIGLKASLVLFFNTLILPYSYLFFVSVFISWAILMRMYYGGDDSCASMA